MNGELFGMIFIKMSNENKISTNTTHWNRKKWSVSVKKKTFRCWFDLQTYTNTWNVWVILQMGLKYREIEQHSGCVWRNQHMKSAHTCGCVSNVWADITIVVVLCILSSCSTGDFGGWLTTSSAFALLSATCVPKANDSAARTMSRTCTNNNNHTNVNNNNQI